jgi:hypothetical protein
MSMIAQIGATGLHVSKRHEGRQAASIKQPLSESQFAHRPPVMLEEVRLVESAHAVGACRASSRILPRQLKIHNS